MNAKTFPQVTANAFTHSLADSFFAARNGGEQDEAICQLLNCIASASAEIAEIFNYGYDVNEFERVVRKRLGLASLGQIREVIAAIAKPIAEDDRRRSKASWIKSLAAGDNVKEDEIYYRVMMPALSLFHNLRECAPNIMTGREIRSGKLVTAKEKRAIKALQPLPKGRKKWAKIIVQLTLSGEYWAKHSALEAGGAIYKALAASAVRNRKRKLAEIFADRYHSKIRGRDTRKISPDGFLLLSADEKMKVIDRSPRAGGAFLDEAKISAVSHRAAKIVNMTATPYELKLALREVVEGRLKTVPRI